MTTNDFTNVHFIGVGGIGMSALARLCLNEKKHVSGTDATSSPITTALVAEGISFTEGHAAEHLPPETEFVIYTEAIDSDNPELIEAKKRKLPTMNYFDALGLFMNEYYLIAISGSHGKTTTTAMLSDIFEAADLDPTVIVGSLRKKTGSNFRPGKSKYAIVEACEFRRDFLSLTPDVLVITNIEYEHVDYYENLADVQKAFREFANQVREGGCIVANTDDSAVAAALEGIDVQVLDYTRFFDPLFDALPSPGLHNRLNAAAAIAVADHLGVDVYLAREALKNFTGTWRRFERKGEFQGAPVYDDYAHHPTEVRMTLTSTKELFAGKRVRAIFQPHTYSRTRELFDDFVKALVPADEVLLLPVYEARHEKGESVTSEGLVTAITGVNPNARAFANGDALITYLTETTTADDVLLFMGAGSVAETANRLTGAESVLPLGQKAKQ